MRPRRRQWITVSVLALIAGLILILAGGQNRAARLADYQLELERLTDEIVELNLPLAEIFSSGAPPNEDLVASTRERLRAVQEDLAALGSPPHELAESRAALVEAVGFYAQAGGHLAENLAKAQPGSPFDQQFLTAAMHGGEAIHRTTTELNTSNSTAPCAGLRRLLPACWLWI